jgi:catalase
MSTVGGTIKNALTSMTNTAKIADLQRCTVEATSSTGITTDHGVLVSDTDNWCVLILRQSLADTSAPGFD